MRYKVVVCILSEAGFGNAHFVYETDDLFKAMDVSKVCALHLRHDYVDSDELAEDLAALRHGEGK